MVVPDDERPVRADAVRKVSDDFFCEATGEEVNKDLPGERPA